MTDNHMTLTIYNRLQQIHVLLDDGDRRSLTPLELTSPQYHALLHLSEAGTNGLTVTELANRLICTRGNATRRAQVLATNGLVRIDNDPSDLRLKRVSLTPEGEALLNRAQDAHLDAVERRLGVLSETEQKQLHRLTEKLVRLLETDLAAG